MKWVQVSKCAENKPSAGNYKEWKEILAQEGNFQCAYCAINEASFGGTRNFHVEHYRPKSRFRDLANDYWNLFYACAICNTFKGSDWPNEPTASHSTPSYPNPCDCNYSDLFSDGASPGLLVGTTVASQYVCERLYLNRPQLVLERRLFSLLDQLEGLSSRLISAVQDANGARAAKNKDLREAVLALVEVQRIRTELHAARPYIPADLVSPKRRPAAKKPPKKPAGTRASKRRTKGVSR